MTGVGMEFLPPSPCHSQKKKKKIKAHLRISLLSVFHSNGWHWKERPKQTAPLRQTPRSALLLKPVSSVENGDRNERWTWFPTISLRFGLDVVKSNNEREDGPRDILVQDIILWDRTMRFTMRSNDNFHFPPGRIKYTLCYVYSQYPLCVPGEVVVKPISWCREDRQFDPNGSPLWRDQR